MVQAVCHPKSRPSPNDYYSLVSLVGDAGPAVWGVFCKRQTLPCFAFRGRSVWRSARAQSRFGFCDRARSWLGCYLCLSPGLIGGILTRFQWGHSHKIVTKCSGKPPRRPQLTPLVEGPLATETRCHFRHGLEVLDGEHHPHVRLYNLLLRGSRDPSTQMSCRLLATGIW